jgi:hypothetical protein
MRLPSVNLANVLAASALIVAGYVAHSVKYAIHAGLPVVQAQSHSSQYHTVADDSLAFQLSGIGPNTALTIYNPNEHTLYVYPEVTQGNTHVNCSFTLHMSRPGAPLDRQNCAPASAY